MEYLSWETLPQPDGTTVETADCLPDENGWCVMAIRLSANFREEKQSKSSSVYWVEFCEGEGIFRHNQDSILYYPDTKLRIGVGDVFYIENTFRNTEILLRYPPRLKEVTNA